jgi:hypothetical protein
MNVTQKREKAFLLWHLAMKKFNQRLLRLGNNNDKSVNCPAVIMTRLQERG